MAKIPKGFFYKLPTSDLTAVVQAIEYIDPIYLEELYNELVDRKTTQQYEDYTVHRRIVKKYLIASKKKK